MFDIAAAISRRLRLAALAFLAMCALKTVAAAVTPHALPDQPASVQISAQSWR